jgi:hypothetical protein
MGLLTKRVRKQRSSTRKNNRKRGGCGCGLTGGKRKNKKSKTNKNKRKVKGGSQHLESVPISHYYPLNDHSSSLSKSYGAESSIANFSGGKKKKMKGGGMLDAIFNGPQLNVATGFGTTAGSKMLYDVQSLNNQQNDNVLDQPAGKLYNEHSPLLA